MTTVASSAAMPAERKVCCHVAQGVRSWDVRVGGLRSAASGCALADGNFPARLSVSIMTG